jgi:citrate synthase
MSDVTYAKGLEGVIAAETSMSRVDGVNGKLYYLGYSITDLVENCDFEEVTYLLLNGELPNKTDLDAFRKKMRDARELKEPIIRMIREFPVKAKPMELLQSSVAYLSGYVKHTIEHSATCNCRETLHQVVQLTGVVAGLARIRAGKEYIPPRMDLSHGANFLYQLNGEEPDEFEGKVMDDALILHAEHGFNASTFTARVVASTISTCYSSISAAIGALYGSLHGGANEKAMLMVETIGDVSNAESYVNKTLDEGGKIMGMGHRVYKAKDPRAVIIEQYLLDLSKRKNDMRYYEILKKVEQVFRDRMEEKGKPIHPNVDFFSGAVYTLLGIPVELFTPIFAMSRVSGWLAHILEQRVDNRLFRPKALYVGHDERPFVPLDQR